DYHVFMLRIHDHFILVTLSVYKISTWIVRCIFEMVGDLLSGWEADVISSSERVFVVAELESGFPSEHENVLFFAAVIVVVA
ncbi:MAG: hypothetical protein L3K26_10485, partial [Candidatus Hydrogenedentes bacterium]|nr:hypothetical protein [Candidatus Hydrogenedentota bacterium]